jgi:hypothetical protein
MKTILLAFVLLVGFVVTARADDLGEAKAFIGKQVALIKKGETAALRAGFTKRLQDRVTGEVVKKAQAEVDKYKLEDLVDAVTAADGGGLKIKMKNGRTLTTLVKVDGAWLADTIWFK